MRKFLRLFAIVLVLAAMVIWAVTGANRGFTMTRIPKPLPDEVTGLMGTAYEDGFVPGVDFLIASFAVAAVLAGASFLFRKNKLEPKGQLDHQ